ncbi:MAG: hypothetical protein RR334_01990 [Clostridia bacterium]
MIKDIETAVDKFEEQRSTALHTLNRELDKVFSNMAVDTGRLISNDEPVGNFLYNSYKYREVLNYKLTKEICELTENFSSDNQEESFNKISKMVLAEIEKYMKSEDKLIMTPDKLVTFDFASLIYSYESVITSLQHLLDPFDIEFFKSAPKEMVDDGEENKKYIGLRLSNGEIIIQKNIYLASSKTRQKNIDEKSVLFNQPAK